MWKLCIHWYFGGLYRISTFPSFFQLFLCFRQEKFGGMSEKQLVISQDNVCYDLVAVKAAIKKPEAIEADINVYEECVQAIIARYGGRLCYLFHLRAMVFHRFVIFLLLLVFSFIIRINGRTVSLSFTITY